MFTVPLHFPTILFWQLAKREDWIHKHSIMYNSLSSSITQVSIVHCLHMDKLELVNHTPWWAMELTSRLKMFLFLFFIYWCTLACSLFINVLWLTVCHCQYSSCSYSCIKAAKPLPSSKAAIDFVLVQIAKCKSEHYHVDKSWAEQLGKGLATFCGAVHRSISQPSCVAMHFLHILGSGNAS